MTLRLHNTLTRKKEVFTPIDPENVRVYFCGPTVYNYAHIGNARGPVVYDVLVGLLRRIYGQGHVQYASNFTDIDDRIMAAAKESGEGIDVLTQKFARIYNEDMSALGVARPDHQPKATAYIPDMLKMIEALLRKGHAYAAEGHVLFHVPSMKDYGALSRRPRDEQVAVARVDPAPFKKDPADFVLWKPSADDQPGWPSLWGRGRPGWHLECSAMNAAINGPHFDIHTGGEDLIFPHHENEIAQSTCAHGKPYVNYWLHHGHLTVEGQKMSKSVGNVLLVHDLVKKYPPEALRYALLSAHYRQPFDFTHDLVTQAKATLDRWYGLMQANLDVKRIESAPPQAFTDALLDDLNTPLALSEISAAAKRLSTAEGPAKERAKAEFMEAAAMLGFLRQTPDMWFRAGAGSDTAAIEAHIADMQKARARKDYKKSDEIRDLLQKHYAVSVSVTKDGITWKKD